MPQQIDQWLSDEVMALYQAFFLRRVGIELASSKKALLYNRLYHRVRALGLPNMLAYYHVIAAHVDGEECQMAIDLVTTNETSFFRDRGNMEYVSQVFMRELAADAQCHIWSAASASGEEAYSLAMLCADTLGHDRWQVIGSDVNHTVLNFARRGLYSMERATRIPAEYLKRYCLKGTDVYDGSFLIGSKLREKVRFMPINLIHVPQETMWEFDVIFLCNVLIYFSQEVRKQVVLSMISRLREGGILVLGNAESLQGMDVPLQTCIPSVYRKIVTV